MPGASLEHDQRTKGILTYDHCFEQTKVMVTASAMGDTYCQVSLTIISTVG